MITPLAALCLVLFGLLAGLAVARYLLVRSLSAGGKHLSKIETFIDDIPARLSSTAGGVTPNLPAAVQQIGAVNSGATGIITQGGGTSGTETDTASGSTTISGSTLRPDGENEPDSATISSSNTTYSTAQDTASGATTTTRSISNLSGPISSHDSQIAQPEPNALITQSSPENSQRLKPAEIAYLLRGGDINHTIIVLAVDLIQRSIKANTSSFSETLSDYEKSMWRIVTRSVKDWATQKVNQTVAAGAKNPIATVRRIVLLYNFIRNSLRGLVADTIADPRHLKKYFSPNGVIRIFIDFTSQGYKQTFQEEIRKSLLRRGLLVPEAVRESVGKRFFAVGAVGFIATFVTSYCLIPNSTAAFVTWFAALAAGFAARTLLSLRHLVPFFDELAVVVGQIRRKSFRLSIVKLLLRSVNTMSWLALVLSLGITLSLGFIFIRACLPGAGWADFGALAAMTVANFTIADFIFNGMKLNIDECPTRDAEKQLEQMRQELEQVSPLETFRAMLASPNYDPTFSKILALYGIETLLFLI